MSKVVTPVPVVLLAIALFGCEGQRVTNGIVKDKETGLPLDKVLCKVIGEGNRERKYTDTFGRFKIYGRFGGCLPECPDIVVIFSKHGYRKREIKNPTDTVFYLTAQKK